MTGKRISTLEDGHGAITSLRWNNNSAGSKSGKMILNVTSLGWISYWNTITGKCEKSFKNEIQDDLYCLDISPEGHIFAVGGNKYSVNIYDINTMRNISNLQKNELFIGHTNRIHAVHFCQNDPNLLISGGFDKNLFFWDLRTTHPIGQIFGPLVMGDSLDIQGNLLIAGSYSNQDILQIYDISKQVLIKDIKWDYEKFTETPLYAAVFDKNLHKYLAAGGAGTNELKIFTSNSDYKLIGKSIFPKEITSIDFMRQKNCFIVGCGNGYTYFYTFEEGVKKEI